MPTPMERNTKARQRGLPMSHFKAGVKVAHTVDGFTYVGVVQDKPPRHGLTCVQWHPNFSCWCVTSELRLAEVKELDQPCAYHTRYERHGQVCEWSVYKGNHKEATGFKYEWDADNWIMQHQQPKRPKLHLAH